MAVPQFKKIKIIKNKEMALERMARKFYCLCVQLLTFLLWW